MSLIEKTGYSYSGVCDVVRNSDCNASATTLLLLEADQKYSSLKKEEEELAKKLRLVRANADNITKLFLQVQEAMGIKEDLVFRNGDKIVTIRRLDGANIAYACKQLTDFSTLNDK